MKYAIDAAGAPESIGPYSQGTTAGRLVFASGQLGIDPSDPHRLVEGGVRAETERVIQIVQAILAEAGCTLADVARTTVYLTDIDDLDAMNEVYAQAFPPPAPARCVVAVSALPMGARVEMDAVACR